MGLESRFLDEENFRALLGTKWKRYTVEFETERPNRTLHALIYHVTLKGRKHHRRSGLRTERFVVKDHLQCPPGFSNEAIYVSAHDPSRLYSLETTNLALIREGLRPLGFSRYPYLEAVDPNARRMVMKNLGNLTKKRQMIADFERGYDYFRKSFLEGLVTIATFDGLCNHNIDFFRRRYNYEADALAYIPVEQAVLRENLTRMYFYYNPECQVEFRSQPYDYHAAIEHLRENKGINLEARIRDLDRAKVVLHKVTKLQHGDCNGSNMICSRRGTKLIDFPNFGLWSSSLDFGSYCIIVGVGNNEIFSSPDFPNLVNTYLTHELVAEGGGYDQFKEQPLSLDCCNSGISSLISERDYANFILSVWDDALRKNVQLAGTFARYKEQTSPRIFGVESSSLIGSDPKVIYNLFTIISKESLPFERCSNPQEAREYFYQFGQIFVELGICSDKYDLTGILESIRSPDHRREGIFDSQWPRFRE